MEPETIEIESRLSGHLVIRKTRWSNRTVCVCSEASDAQRIAACLRALAHLSTEVIASGAVSVSLTGLLAVPDDQG